MRSLRRYDPFQEFRRAMMSPFFEDSFFEDFGSQSSLLALDIRNEGDQLVAEADLPGFSSDDVSVTATTDTLTISAQQSTEERQDVRDEYVRRERKQVREFSRSVTLPSQIKPEEVEASFENGILKIAMPKLEKEKPQSVDVQIK